MIDQHKQHHHHHRQQDQHQQGEQHGHRSEDQGIRQDLNSQLDQLDKIEVVNKIDLQAHAFSKLIAAFCGRASIWLVFFLTPCAFGPLQQRRIGKSIKWGGVAIGGQKQQRRGQSGADIWSMSPGLPSIFSCLGYG